MKLALHKPLAIVWLFVASACSNSTPPPSPQEIWGCYSFSYLPDSRFLPAVLRWFERRFLGVTSARQEDSGFPEAIALLQGKDGAQAFWIQGQPDTIGVGRMFQEGGSWRRTEGDSILVTFSNGFSGVTLELTPTAEGFNGRATWLIDIVDGTPPPSSKAVGTKVLCEDLVGDEVATMPIVPFRVDSVAKNHLLSDRLAGAEVYQSHEPPTASGLS